jgi:hypothetical protein
MGSSAVLLHQQTGAELLLVALAQPPPALLQRG